jgi:hypothetical protein
MMSKYTYPEPDKATLGVTEEQNSGLLELSRLLARQAAREWVDNCTPHTSAPETPHAKDHTTKTTDH